jgi:hypothetical protein
VRSRRLHRNTERHQPEGRHYRRQLRNTERHQPEGRHYRRRQKEEPRTLSLEHGHHRHPRRWPTSWHVRPSSWR